jgi:hypothetical protein
MKRKLGSSFLYRNTTMIIDVFVKIKDEKYKILEIDRRTRRGLLYFFDANENGIKSSKMHGPDGNENIERSVNVE